MALAETARLIASLELKDKFSPGVASATRSLGTLETRLGRIGPLASRGARTAITNLTKIGLVVGAGLGVAVKSGLDSLAELESATVAADAAIKQMGLTGQVTGAQIAGWAQEIETAIGAAFDDKAIVAASTTLIRFGKVTGPNLHPALEVVADLATKTGDVDSAATLLAKALADPTKAAGKLARQGIILTKEQQDQIKAMVKAGKTGEAQALILAEVEKATKGAALASQGPYQRALSTLADVTEDAQRALAEGFLPVIERVAAFLSQKLADPRVISDIRSLGRSLAGAFDKAVTAAQNIPWESIKSAMKLAGQGAKAALDLFTGLPPWVQTAVLTGWGLNKLTGGALGGIISELGKGLIKGVLGMNAGVVNINAGVVNGPGGVPGVGGKGGPGMVPFIGKVLAGAAIEVAALTIVSEEVVVPGLQGQAGTNIGSAQEQLKTGSLEDLKTALRGLQEMPNKLNPIQKLLYDNNAYGVKSHNEAMQQAYAAEILRRTGQTALEATFGQMGSVIQDRLDAGNSLLAYINAGIPQIPMAFGAAATGINAALGTVNTAITTGFGKTTAAVYGDTTGTATKLEVLRQASMGASAQQRAALNKVAQGIARNELTLVGIKGTTAGTTAAINRKNFSPTIKVPVMVTNNVSVRTYMDKAAVVNAYSRVTRKDL